MAELTTLEDLFLHEVRGLYDAEHRLMKAIPKLIKAARSPELKPRLLEQGAEPIGGTPEEFARLLREDVAKYADAVRISGARPE